MMPEQLWLQLVRWAAQTLERDKVGSQLDTVNFLALMYLLACAFTPTMPTRLVADLLASD